MKSIVYFLTCSVLLAVFGVTAIFLGAIISYKFMILSFVYYCSMAILYAMILQSNKYTESITKWLLSLPLSYLIFQYFWKTNYAVRALNWVFNDYGEQSAGGNFDGMVQLASFGLFLITSIIGFNCVKIKNQYKFKILQIGIGSVIGCAIVIITLILEKSFPSYSSIFGG